MVSHFQDAVGHSGFINLIVSSILGDMFWIYITVPGDFLGLSSQAGHAVVKQKVVFRKVVIFILC